MICIEVVYVIGGFQNECLSWSNLFVIKKIEKASDE